MCVYICIYIYRERERQRDRDRERETERERDREREREKILCFEGFYLEVSGKDLNRLFTSFPGVSFQGHGL